MVCIWASLFLAIFGGVCWLAYVAIGETAPAWVHGTLPVAAVASVIAAAVAITRCKYIRYRKDKADAVRPPEAPPSGAVGQSDAR